MKLKLIIQLVITMNPARRVSNYLQASSQRHVEIGLRVTNARTKAEVITEIDNNLPRMNFFNLVAASSKLGRLTDPPASRGVGT